MGTFIKKTREERIKEILDIATEVFLEKGFQNTTMEDIIKVTTLSKGGFYYYFKSTSDIFFAILDRKTKKEIESTAHLVNQSCKTSAIIEDICEHICDEFEHGLLQQFDEHALYLMAAVETVNDPKFLNYCREMEEKNLNVITKSLQEKLVDVDLEVLENKLKFLTSMYHAMVLHCYIFKDEELYTKNIGTIKNIFMEILSEI